MPPSRRSAIALRHVVFEDLGLLAPILGGAPILGVAPIPGDAPIRGDEPILGDTAWHVRYCDAPTADLSDPAIEQADLLIVLGGPIGVYDADAFPFLVREIELLERRLAKGLPTLGICLGAQLMAKALGSRVLAGPVKEIGWGSVELTEAGKASCLRPLADHGATVLHWHGDTFDLPDGATRLASNARYPNQAFAYGQRALALQFHLEADRAPLEQWYVGHSAELAAAGVSIPDLRAATAAIAGTLRAQAERIFGAWLRQIR